MKRIAFLALALLALLPLAGSQATLFSNSSVSVVIATRTVNADAVNPLPATAFWTFGAPLKKGDVPSGNILTADMGGTSVPFGCVARRTHPDGSLAWADCSVNMSGVSISAGASKDLHLTSIAGTWPSTNHRTDSDWQGLLDAVEITNLTTTAGQADLSNVSTASNYVQFETRGAGWFNGNAAWYTSGDATTIASSGTLPAPLATATTYGLCNVTGTTQYRFYDTPAHAAAGGATCTGTGLITLTTAGTCSTIACTLAVTAEADMASANLWKCSFNNAATVISYGDDQNSHRVVVKAPCIDQTTSTTHRHLIARMDYDVFENANTTLGPIASRGPFIENIQGFKNNPSEFDYDLAWKRNGVLQRSQASNQHAVFSRAALTRTDGLRDWSANDSQVWISQDYRQTRKTKKIQPFPDGIVSTYLVKWSVSAINTSTGVFTSNGYGFIGNASGSTTNLAVDFTWTSQPTGLSLGVGYWSCKVDANNFKIYDTLPHAVTCGATGQVIPSSTGSGVVVRNAVAPFTTAQIDTQEGAGGGESDGLGLTPEWPAQYHVANTQDAQRLARVVAVSFGGPSYALLNDATGKIPCLTIAAQCPAGLGAHKETTYWSSCSGPIVNHTSNDIGGGGCWTGSSGTLSGGWPGGHWSNPVYDVWLMEGGAYLRDLLYDNATRAVGNQVPAVNRNFPVGGTTYYATTLYEQFGSVRSNVWNFRDKLKALFAAPDGSGEQAYLHQIVKNDYDAYTAEQATLDANLQAFGYYGGNVGSNYITNHTFMEWYSGMVASFGALLFSDDTSFGTAAQAFNNNFVGGWLASIYNTYCPYYADAYVLGPNTDAGVFQTTFNDLGTAGGSSLFVSYDSATNLITFNNSGMAFTPVNGDKFRPSKYDSLLGVETGTLAVPPSPFVAGTWYFLKNVTVGGTTTTANLENSPGSGTITIGATVSNSGGMFHQVAGGSPSGCPSSGTSGASGNGDTGYIADSITALGTSAVAGNANSATALLKAQAKFTTTWNAHASRSAQGAP